MLENEPKRVKVLNAGKFSLEELKQFALKYGGVVDRKGNLVYFRIPARVDVHFWRARIMAKANKLGIHLQTVFPKRG